MKKIDKVLLDGFIEVHRDLVQTDVMDGLAFSEAVGRCHERAERVQAACGVYWGAADDFMHSLLRKGGIFPEASNEDIYRVLEMLGWEVT